jgi:ADP-heptose:LPS heptosyltransferase
VLTRDYRVSLLPQIYRTRVIEVGISELTKLDLPNHKLTEKLVDMRYDAILDLNRAESLFAIYLLQAIPSKVRIGFKRKGSDKYYNLQIANNEEKAENSYNNYLNCLKMF